MEASSQIVIYPRCRLLVTLLLVALLISACELPKGEEDEPVAVGESDMEVSLAELTQRDMDNILAMPEQTGELGIAATTTYFCNSPDPMNMDTGNGSITYTFNDVDPPGRSTGDNYETLYANCTHSVSLAGEVVIDGSIAYLVNELTGTPFQTDIWTIDTTAAANLSVAMTVATRTIVSNYHFQYGTSDGITITRAVNGDSSYTQSMGGIQTGTSRVFDGLYTENTLVQRYETIFDVSTESIGVATRQYATAPSLSGSVSLPPDAGAMVVTTNDATTGITSIVTITALGDGNVQVDTDNDGDGVIDQSVQTTWSAIGSLWRMI